MDQTMMFEVCPLGCDFRSDWQLKDHLGYREDEGWEVD